MSNEMSKKRLPGFTAEASVYKTNLQYRSSGTQGSGMRNSIIPQAECNPYSAPNSCYNSSVDCYGVVLICEYCCYDEFGRLSEDGTEVCGACFGFPF
jgi:hypothetical protein